MNVGLYGFMPDSKWYHRPSIDPAYGALYKPY